MDRQANAAATTQGRWHIQARFGEHMDMWLEECFDGIILQLQPDGSTLLSGTLRDISEVYGLILQLRDGAGNLLCLEVRRRQS